jgi:hypothetical protein
MTPFEKQEQLRISLAVSRYLDAIERCDDGVIDALWRQTATDPDLLVRLREVNDYLACQVDESEIEVRIVEGSVLS